MQKLLFLLAFLALTIACNKAEKQAKEDRQLILDDLEAKGLTASEDPSGIFFIIDVIGSGANPTLADNVEVKYKGTFLDHRKADFSDLVFDETTGNSTANFPLFNLIEGWQIAIPMLKKGGKGRFWIPSALAYGPSGSQSIPGDEPLFFEITLVDF